jgi:hypothetical protein
MTLSYIAPQTRFDSTRVLAVTQKDLENIYNKKSRDAVIHSRFTAAAAANYCCGAVFSQMVTYHPGTSSHLS